MTTQEIAAIAERQKRMEAKLDAIIVMMLSSTIVSGVAGKIGIRYVYEDVLDRILGSEESGRLFEWREDVFDK